MDAFVLQELSAKGNVLKKAAIEQKKANVAVVHLAFVALSPDDKLKFLTAKKDASAKARALKRQSK